MTRIELIKNFLIALKVKYPRYEIEPQYSKKLFFKDRFVQRLWEGFQLCNDQLPTAIPAMPMPMPLQKESSLEENRMHVMRKLGVKPGVKNLRQVNTNELSIEIINTTFSIVYRNSQIANDDWILCSAFLNLWDAVLRLNDIASKGVINLNKWECFKGNPNQYFLAPKTSGHKTHIWGINDTLCRSWRNKTMTPKKYALVDNDNIILGETVICTNCISHITSMNLKADLKFDSEHRLTGYTPQ